MTTVIPESYAVGDSDIEATSVDRGTGRRFNPSLHFHSLRGDIAVEFGEVADLDGRFEDEAESRLTVRWFVNSSEVVAHHPLPRS